MAYDLLFASSAGALREKLADPRWLGATHCGFTGILHTWTQRLLFHPHIHCRTAIGDSRIRSVRADYVSFQWKDRANNDAICTDTIPGTPNTRRIASLTLHRACSTMGVVGGLVPRLRYTLYCSPG